MFPFPPLLCSAKSVFPAVSLLCNGLMHTAITLLSHEDGQWLSQIYFRNNRYDNYLII